MPTSEEVGEWVNMRVFNNDEICVGGIRGLRRVA